MIAENQSNESVDNYPSNNTLKSAVKLSILEDKPIMSMYEGGSKSEFLVA